MREIGRKDFALSILLYSPTRRAHRDAQTPHLCEFRLAVEFGLAINLIIAPVNSSVARQRVSLSSGIRMFARER